MDFSELINPINATIFFSQYWEKTPLILQGRSPNIYDELLTVESIDHILTTTWLRFPALRLVRTGSELGLRYYTKPFGWGGKTFLDVVDVPQVVSAYQQGATIVIEALHRYWKPLALFCETVTKEISLRLQANVYVSPPNGQGLALHHDTHDVFVLQIHGNKHWRLFEATVDVPNKKFRFDQKKSTVGMLMREVTLSPGDLLYIPRGVGHEAVTTDTASIHITVGLEFYKWIDLFRKAIEDLENDVEFRRSMPPYFLERDTFGECEIEHLKLLMAKVHDVVFSHEMVGRIQEQFLSAQSPTYDGLFTTILNLSNINADTKIFVRQNLVYRLVESSETIVLMFGDKKVTFPAHVKSALEAICNRAQLSVLEIPELDQAGQILLGKILAREGFVLLNCPA